MRYSHKHTLPATIGLLQSIANAISIVIGGVIFQNEMNMAHPRLVDMLGRQVADHFKGDQAAANLEFIGILQADEQIIDKQALFEGFKRI